MADDFDTPAERDDASQWLQDMSSGEDEFEGLRRKSARASTVYEDMEVADDEEAPAAANSGLLLGRFTPAQGLILAFLILLNVIAGIIFLLVITGSLDFF
jgi:hypothetical protein